MRMRFSLNSPQWQIEWFRSHWKNYWDQKIKTRDSADAALDMPATESREDFSNYLKSCDFDSFLDENKIVCVELTVEEYAAAYYSTSNIE